MSNPIYRCVNCIKDVNPDSEGQCPNCGLALYNRCLPHTPHWSRHTMNQMICKICDRVITDLEYMNAPELRLGYCYPEQWIKPEPETCNCSEFKLANTFSESRGRILNHNFTHGWRLSWQLPAINYCPWCGKNVPTPKE